MTSDVDEKILAQVGGVDWHRVCEADAARFGLAVGIYRDSHQSWQLFRTAWGTATCSVISICALTLVCMVAGAGPAFTLGLVIAHQAVLRALYAYMMDKPPHECPSLPIPLHTVIQLTPNAYGCEERRFRLDPILIEPHHSQPPAP